MSDFWAVTSYFNPIGWTSRRRNYDCFRRHLTVPLLTVEWHPDGNFELGPDDADRLVQISGGDLVWQKERLLNLAVEGLPEDVATVAWLDCAVVFTDPTWVDRTRVALERHEVLQPFSRAHYLTPAQTAALTDAREVDVPTSCRPSGAGVMSGAGALAADGVAALVDADLRGQRATALTGPGRTLPRSPGLAWAARRTTLDEIGLFDRGIIGSGDLFWLLAVAGGAQRWLRGAAELGYAYLADSSYGDWASAATRVDDGVGHLDGDVLHLHHGDLADRHYKDRHRRFDDLGLDIDRDLVVDVSGAWGFRESRPAWEQFFAEYFLERHEDGGPVGA